MYNWKQSAKVTLIKELENAPIFRCLINLVNHFPNMFRDFWGFFPFHPTGFLLKNTKYIYGSSVGCLTCSKHASFGSNA